MRRKAKPEAEPVTVLLNLFAHRKIWALPEGRTEDLERLFPKVRFLLAAGRAALRENLPAADVLFSWHLPKELLSRAKRLKWMHTPAAGVEHLLYPAFRSSPILLTNSRGVGGDAMAEHVLALLFALARRLTDAMRMQSNQQWGQDAMWSTEPTPFRLAGRTLGIVGLGGIGTELARRASALGMTVIGLKRLPKRRPRFVKKLLGPEGLYELLEQSDFVVLALPLTPQTRAFMGAREFSRMKKTAYLLNVGRGEHINESALVKALRAKTIAGAALDVFQTEPLPKRSVLWRVPNLLVSPHYAGTYSGHMDRATDAFADNLKRFLAGRTLRSVVDKKTGY